MKKMILSAIGALVFSSALFAEPSKEELLNFKQGVRVHRNKQDNGVISRVTVVGKAKAVENKSKMVRSNAFRNSRDRAAQYAKAQAKENALQQFVGLLATKCKWGKTASGQAVFSLVNAAEKKSDTQDSGFAEGEMHQMLKWEAAQACIPGLQTVCEGIDAQGYCTWVGCWDASSAPAFEEIKSQAQKALLSLESGVQRINRCTNGKIISILVVGVSPVPPNLRRKPIDQIAEFARPRAQDDAQNQFVRHLSADAHGRISMSRATKEQKAVVAPALHTIYEGIDKYKRFKWIGVWDVEVSPPLKKLKAQIKDNAN